MDFAFLRFHTLSSTNTTAAEHARGGAHEGLCIIADEQTAGRGRQGREWVSKRGSGLFISIVLRPKLEPKHLTLIPLMAAVAVHEVLLKTCLIEPDIKWPNDVLVREKKICGILSEAVDTPQGLAVVLGIGINLKDEGMPENATAVKAVSTVEIDRDQLVDALIEQLDEAYRRLNSRPASIIDEWKERSTYFEDKAVEVRSGRDAFSGVTCGLEENGALRVTLADGSVRIVQAGDVERVRADN